MADKYYLVQYAKKELITASNTHYGYISCIKKEKMKCIPGGITS
jgi:hypothetical protein